MKLNNHLSVEIAVSQKLLDILL